MGFHRWLGLVLGLGLAFPGVACAVVDFADCASELDTLRTRADDASDAAEQAENICAEYDDCRADPESLDLLGDECASARRECGNERDSLRSELDDVESAIRSVQASCGYAFELDPQKALERLKKLLHERGMAAPPKSPDKHGKSK